MKKFRHAKIESSAAPRQRTLEAEDEEKKYQKLFFSVNFLQSPLN